MQNTASRPRWAEPIPRTEPDGRIVKCGGCGRPMSWARFVHEHGPACDGGADRKEEVA